MDDDTKANISLLRGRVKRMERLIEGILDYSRVGRILANNTMVNLNEMIVDITQSLDPHNLVSFTIPPNLPTIYTEQLALEQVITNFISNGIKYNQSKKIKIDIAFKEINNYYEFCVSDNGIGIDKKFQDKIFVIFQTLQARDVYESTGVGLAIVKKIIEEKGGIIKVDSETGKGSQFTFTWPNEKDNNKYLKK